MIVLDHEERGIHAGLAMRQVRGGHFMAKRPAWNQGAREYSGL
jgi:hypothetical protein